VRWQRVINFGDLKELLFDDGRFSCVVRLADRRPVAPDGTLGDPTDRDVRLLGTQGRRRPRPSAG
jgi:hypothetical protein